MDAGKLSKSVKSLLRSKGFPLIHLRRCEDDDLSSFSEALWKARNQNTYGAFVDYHDPDELRREKVTAFLSRNKKAGVAVWPDGDIRAVFKNRKFRKRLAIGELMLTAISAGGCKLDCYGLYLSKLYAKFGFIPVARVKFDRREAQNWKDEFGEPDIIFWKHCGDPVETVAEKIGSYPTYSEDDLKKLPCFNYDDARRFRDEEMKRERQNTPITV